MTWTWIKRFVCLVFVFSLFAGPVTGFVMPGEDSSSYSDSYGSDSEWFSPPTYDSQEELLYEILAPFAFVTILLQLALKRALTMTFATDDDNNPFTQDEGPNVFREATVMAVTISVILMASPYWTLMRKMAASIGLLSVAGVILVILYLAYLFLKG